MTDPVSPASLGKTQVSELLSILEEDLNLEREKSEAIAHAFVDIQESMQKIYGILIPNFLATRSLPMSQVLDALWSIREEFRHVEYHIRDAGLLDL